MRHEQGSNKCTVSFIVFARAPRTVGTANLFLINHETLSRVMQPSAVHIKDPFSLPISVKQVTEHYETNGEFGIRKVVLSDGREISTEIPLHSNIPEDEDAQSLFDYSFLRLKKIPQNNFSEQVTSAELFSGCGCLSLGASEACRAIGKKFVPLVAIDKDTEVMDVYTDNFKPMKTYSRNICNIIDGHLYSEPTPNEEQLKKECFGNSPPLSILLAGPPCSGYSSLNNFIRKEDDRNVLYERVARFVELTEPENVLIENVPAVIHCKNKVVDTSIQLMKDMGYHVDSGTVNLGDIGVPQLRKRHIIVASKRKKVLIENIVEKYKVKRKRTFAWATGDIQDEQPADLMSTPTKHSDDNVKRIAYLHHNNEYDLPNELRPKCHQGEHGYKSMYGRMRLDKPAQTITSGFPSPGQGRFIHPTKQRTIIPHEAARLQFIPDYFDFSKAKTKSSLSLMIGNGAPMKLSYVFCLELLT